jgi:hypothetical protein
VGSVSKRLDISVGSGSSPREERLGGRI